MAAPIEQLLEQEVEWFDLPEPDEKDGLYAVREGTLEIGGGRLRTYVLNNEEWVFDADDVVKFFGVAAEDGEQAG